jgi:hypothetical protein
MPGLKVHPREWLNLQKWGLRNLSESSENDLAGGIPTPLKNDGVTASWDDLFPINDGNVIKNSMVPPTRIYT